MMRHHGPAKADHGPAKAVHYVLAGLILVLGTDLIRRPTENRINISSLETVSSTCGG